MDRRPGQVDLSCPCEAEVENLKEAEEQLQKCKKGKQESWCVGQGGSERRAFGQFMEQPTGSPPTPWCWMSRFAMQLCSLDVP